MWNWKKRKADLEAETPEGMPVPDSRKWTWHHNFWLYFVLFLAILGLGSFVGWYIVSAFGSYTDRIAPDNPREKTEGPRSSGEKSAARRWNNLGYCAVNVTSKPLAPPR